MFEILQSREDIDRAQALLKRQLASYRHERARAYVGYRGGRYDGDVQWFPGLGFWYVTQVVRDGKQYWNGFGREKPEEGATLSIACEVNSPIEGVNRRIGGAFARDSNGEFWLVHRGKIGGGRPGIGKSSFTSTYRGEWVAVDDGGRVTDVVPISPIASSRLAVRLRGFIEEVTRIKAEAGRPREFDDDSLFSGFSDEFSGRRAAYSSVPIEANCDHGLVVNALAREAEHRGIAPHNDKHRDLYLRDPSGSTFVLFEVKTGDERSILYTAVGQVLLNAIPMGDDVLKVLVLPRILGRQFAEALGKLGIETVSFSIDEASVQFFGLERVWRQLSS